MDALASFGTRIHVVMGPTMKVYRPLLASNSRPILSTKRDTFSYGSHPRQQLDAYSPDAPTGKDPILIYIYGGGFSHGDRTLRTIPSETCYANVGHFFTREKNGGFIVLVPDYRTLAQQAAFPSGGEDVDMLFHWVIGHYGASSCFTRSLFVMCNSSGGAHLLTWLWHPLFALTRKKVLPWDITSEDGSSTRQVRTPSNMFLNAVVLLSVPFHFRLADTDPDWSRVIADYYLRNVKHDEPKSILDRYHQDPAEGDLSTLLRRGPKMLALVAEFDPEWIKAPNRDLIDIFLENSVAEKLSVGMLIGHNHVSPYLSLGTGIAKEEMWGRVVARWMVTAIGSVSEIDVEDRHDVIEGEVRGGMAGLREYGNAVEGYDKHTKGKL